MTEAISGCSTCGSASHAAAKPSSPTVGETASPAPAPQVEAGPAVGSAEHLLDVLA